MYINQEGKQMAHTVLQFYEKCAPKQAALGKTFVFFFC